MALAEAVDENGKSEVPYLQKIEALREEIGRIVVGQSYMVERLLIGLFTQGHILLEGIPGLAKTLTVNTLARSVSLSFQRIQFTPDLLPADLIGTMIYNPKSHTFEVKKGPIFANIILSDEINRSPAKVQSALLEAMQEKQVTIGKTTHVLEAPFLVLATQNPVEQEGTYPLPEAQIDRFMMRIHVDYLSKEEELTMMRRVTAPTAAEKVKPILNKADIFAIQQEIHKVGLSESLEKYIVELVFATRFPADYRLDKIKNYIAFGASPRASIYLNTSAKTIAFMRGRGYVLPEDIKDVAYDVLNHRILLHYEAAADGVNIRSIVEDILNKVPIKK